MSDSLHKIRLEAIEIASAEIRGWAQALDVRAGRGEGASPEDLRAMADEWFRKVALELEIAAVGGFEAYQDRGLVR